LAKHFFFLDVLFSNIQMNLSSQNTHTKAIIALILVCIFWGTTYLAIRLGLSGSEDTKVHGFFLAALRQSVAGIILISWMLFNKVKFPSTTTFMQLSALGVLMLSMGNGFASWSMHYIPSGLASVMSASGPVFIAILSHFLIAKVNWTFQLIGGMILGIIGVIGISFDYIDSFDKPGFSFGLILNFMATVVWSVGSVLAAKWKPDVNLLMGAGIQMLVGGLIMWCVVGFVGYGNLVQGTLGFNFWCSVIYLIVFGSLISYSAFMYTLEHLPPAQASLYAYINPIVAVLLGWWVLHENLNLITILSMLTTITGVFLVNSSFKKNKKEA
jgi:drug/metabolite transporter (DMT)-like permease